MPNQIDPIILLTGAYTAALSDEYKRHPEKFSWPREKLPEIVTNMMTQVAKGNNGYRISKPLKQALRALGVRRFTYRAINEFVNSKPEEKDLTVQAQRFYQILIEDSND